MHKTKLLLLSLLQIQVKKNSFCAALDFLRRCTLACFTFRNLVLSLLRLMVIFLHQCYEVGRITMRISLHRTPVTAP